MRTFGRVLAVVAWCGAAAALADPNDFVISKLGNPAGPNGQVAQANFEVFARELGSALTSSDLMTPGTLGHAGFNVSLELSTVSLEAADDTKPGFSTTGPPPPDGFYLPTEA